MARRGRCRCGSVLQFRRGPEGYKTRCPSCGSVVRLRAAARPAARDRTVTCPCGTAVPVRSGMRKATCSHCRRELDLPERKAARRGPAPRPAQAGNGAEVLPKFGSAEGADLAAASASELPTGFLPASRPVPKGGRTVACEVCRTVVPVQATECPACGSALALTAAAPVVDLEPKHSAPRGPVPKALPYRLILGWLAASAALLVIAAIVLILSLRH